MHREPLARLSFILYLYIPKISSSCLFWLLKGTSSQSDVLAPPVLSSGDHSFSQWARLFTTSHKGYRLQPLLQSLVDCSSVRRDLYSFSYSQNSKLFPISIPKHPKHCQSWTSPARRTTDGRGKRRRPHKNSRRPASLAQDTSSSPPILSKYSVWRLLPFVAHHLSIWARDFLGMTRKRGQPSRHPQRIDSLDFFARRVGHFHLWLRKRKKESRKQPWAMVENIFLLF